MSENVPTAAQSQTNWSFSRRSRILLPGSGGEGDRTVYGGSERLTGENYQQTKGRCHDGKKDVLHFMLRLKLTRSYRKKVLVTDKTFREF